MKRRRMYALAALALLAAGVVWAATEVQDGQSTRGVQMLQLVGGIKDADSTGAVFRLDANNNLMTSNASPDQTFLIKHTNILQASLYHTYARITGGTLKQPQFDSSSAVPMLGANRAAIALRYTLDDSTAYALLMLEVRCHYTANTDSINTFIVRAWGRQLQAAAPARDTIGAIYDGTMANHFNNALTDTAQAVFGERPVYLSRTNPFRAIWIPLTHPDTGDWITAPYMSVRVRVIRTYGASGAANTGTAAPATAIQADLIGWR